MLTPCPPGPDARQTRDLQILRLELHVHLLGLGQHSDRAGAGVNAPLGFRGRHPLHPMHAAFVLEPFIDVRAVELEDDFLVAAQVRGAGIQILDLPAARLRIAGVHPVEVSRKQGRLLAARAGADLDDGVARIRRVRRQDAALDFQAQPLLFGFQPGDLLLGHLCQLGFRRLGREQGAVLRQLGQGLQVGLPLRHERLEPGVVLPQLLRPLLVGEHLRVAQRGLDLSQAAGELLNLGA